MSSRAKSHEFPETRWTLIDVLQREGHPEQQSALDLLIGSYWPPIYAFLRKSGKNRERAMELTQSFFVEVVLTRRLFEQADANRGQLRSYMLKALKRHIIDEHRHATAGVDRNMVRVDLLPREDSLVGRFQQTDPDQMFDRRWALALIEEALRRCESHFDDGKVACWRAFEARAIFPSMSMGQPPTFQSIAQQFGFKSADDAVAAVRAVRKKFLTILRSVVGETTLPAEAEAEFKRILAILT